MLYKGYHAPTFAFSCNNTAFLAPVQPTRCCSLSSVLPTSACRRSKWRKQNLNCFWEGEAKNCFFSFCLADVPEAGLPTASAALSMATGTQVCTP